MSAAKSRFVLAVTGLAAEARIAERAAQVRAIAGGGDSVRLASLLERVIAEGTSAIISFGLAGGLDPALAPGQVVVADAVFDGTERHETDPHWARLLQTRIPDVMRGRIAGVEKPVVGTAEKAALHAASGALAVDMESHVAARLAAKHKLPFAALRVIADPANRNVPAAALAGMRSDGTTNVGAVLKYILRDPAQLGGLIGLARDAARAQASLLGCLGFLGPGFGFFDLG